MGVQAQQTILIIFVLIFNYSYSYLIYIGSLKICTVEGPIF